MKRFYLLAIAMISALSMLAETSVQNTFFGCTLGKSTSEEVQAAMISQGFKLRDSKSSNILGVQELDCNYTGKYNHEGREFPIFHTLFWNDTLAQVSFRDTCDGDCSKFVDAVQITQANLEQKYGYVGLVDDRSGLLAYNIDEHFFDTKIRWARQDKHTIVESVLYNHAFDYTYICVYRDAEIYRRERQLWNKVFNIDSFMSLFGYDGADYSEENKVYGVAGVKFGDDKETVRKIIALKSERFLSTDAHTLRYYKTQIGGIAYDYASFYFIQEKLVAVDLQKPFYSWQNEEALMNFETVKYLYERKYSNFKMIKDEYEEKSATCGVHMNGDNYPPITIIYSKSISRGGQLMYYIIVSYYGMKIVDIYNKDI